jgi:ABC-2 type transport system permease protein
MTETPITAARRLPSGASLLMAQIRYQSRLLLSSGRGLAIGIGLPVILLVASNANSQHTHPNVGGYAIFGLTITAWNTYGVRLVAAREAGVLKRWRATPLPRWCYFVGAVFATALVAVMAGAVTVGSAYLLYGPHFHDGPTVHLTGQAALAILVALFLGALAWAATATALTSIIPTVESAFPTMIFTYFPVIIISGVLFSISEPHWLSTFATYLPAQPLLDSVIRAVHPVPGAPFLPTRDLIVLAAWAVGGLLAAILVFRWEPHRPAKRRTARAKS